MHIAQWKLQALGRKDLVQSVVGGALAGLVIAALAWPVMQHLRPAAAAAPATVTLPVDLVPEPGPPRFADFRGTTPSADALYIANWVADSRDNAGRPYVLVDKHNAHVYVFDADGQLLGDTPVLLGAAAGDDSVPGIGSKAIEDIPEHERTTPAGRFMAQRGLNARNEDVVWIDYDAAVSMHRVVSTVASERRLQRLASPTVADNRISWGCINVPVDFFETQLAPHFRDYRGPVYVLPETRSLQAVFPQAYDPSSRRQSPSSGMT